MPAALNRDQWLSVLERIASELGREGPAVRLCLIGSAACLLGGMEGRSSRDLDVWRAASDYDRLDLRRAVEAAGCLFDPKTTLLPDTPYLQIVDPGPAELGNFQPVLVDRMGRLEIYRPPIENLIASKLVRGDARDIEDVLFLAGAHQVTVEQVRNVLDTFSPRGREQAAENLIYLNLIEP